MWYVYIIRSLKSGYWYTGLTSNLRKRFSQHQNGDSAWTKAHRPFELIYYEGCLRKADAEAREKYLKSGMGKRYLKNRLKRFLSLTGLRPVRSLTQLIINVGVLRAVPNSISTSIIYRGLLTGLHGIKTIVPRGLPRLRPAGASAGAGGRLFAASLISLVAISAFLAPVQVGMVANRATLTSLVVRADTSYIQCSYQGTSGKGLAQTTTTYYQWEPTSFDCSTLGSDGTKVTGSSLTCTSGDPTTASTDKSATGKCVQPGGSGGALQCLSLGTCIPDFVYLVTVEPTSIFAGIGAFVFSVAVQLTLSSTAYALSFLTQGWTTVRDVANIAFLFILIYIAFSTILNANTSSTLHTLIWVLIMALVVNFSFFITRVVIDAGNIVAVQVYNVIPSANGKSLAASQDQNSWGYYACSNQVPRIINQGNVVWCNAKDLSSSIMSALNIQQLYSTKAFQNWSKGQTLTSWGQTALLVILYIGSAVVLAMVGFMLLAAAAKFIFRTLALWMVLLSSPLAFASHAIPGQSRLKQWFGHLIKNTFYPAIFLFMFLFIVLFLNQAGNCGQQGGCLGIIGNVFYNTQGNASFTFGSQLIIALGQVGIIMGLIIGLMYGAIKGSDIAADFGVNASNKFAGWASGKYFGGIARTYRNTFGRGSLRLSQNRLIRRIPVVRGALDKLAGASFDVRNAPLGIGRRFQEAGGGRPAEGGFRAAREAYRGRRVERRAEIREADLAAIARRAARGEMLSDQEKDQLQRATADQLNNFKTLYRIPIENLVDQLSKSQQDALFTSSKLTTKEQETARKNASNALAAKIADLERLEAMVPAIIAALSAADQQKRLDDITRLRKETEDFGQREFDILAINNIDAVKRAADIKAINLAQLETIEKSLRYTQQDKAIIRNRLRAAVGKPIDELNALTNKRNVLMNQVAAGTLAANDPSIAAKNAEIVAKRAEVTKINKPQSDILSTDQLALAAQHNALTTQQLGWVEESNRVQVDKDKVINEFFKQARADVVRLGDRIEEVEALDQQIEALNKQEQDARAGVINTATGLPWTFTAADRIRRDALTSDRDTRALERDQLSRKTNGMTERYWDAIDLINLERVSKVLNEKTRDRIVSDRSRRPEADKEAFDKNWIINSMYAPLAQVDRALTQMENDHKANRLPDAVKVVLERHNFINAGGNRVVGETFNRAKTEALHDDLKQAVAELRAEVGRTQKEDLNTPANFAAYRDATVKLHQAEESLKKYERGISENRGKIEAHHNDHHNADLAQGVFMINPRT